MLLLDTSNEEEITAKMRSAQGRLKTPGPSGHQSNSIKWDSKLASDGDEDAGDVPTIGVEGNQVEEVPGNAQKRMAIP